MSVTLTNRSDASSRGEFIAGLKRGVPVSLMATPFAILFGTLAVENGLSVGEALLMSAIVFAGASQMVGIDLFGQKIAPWVILLSIFAVNLRMVLYSAAIGRRAAHWSVWKKAVGFFFLVDPLYAESERHAGEGNVLSFAWFMGHATSLYVLWIVGGWLGAEFGRLVPDPYAVGLDFLLPIYFLGMVFDFRKRPLWLPVVLTSAVASVVGYHFVGSPWHVSLGAAAGILLAAVMTPDAEGRHRIGRAGEERP